MRAVATLLALSGLSSCLLTKPRHALARAAALGASAFSCKDGHKLGGGDMHVANVTASAAIQWCGANPRCAGFTAANVSCSTAGVIEAHFQDSWGAHRLHATPHWASWNAAPAPPAPRPPAPPPMAVVQRLLVDLEAPRQPFVHSWKRSFGSGHAKLTRRRDWRQQLALAHRELGMHGVRFHGTFDDDMSVVTPRRTTHAGNALQQRWVYNFTMIDSMWDYLTSLDIDVIVELSFMPCYLANCSWRGVNPIATTPCQTSGVIRNYAGVTQPPVNFEDWYSLVRASTQHAVERYGLARVRQWKFEVWNELWGMPFCSGPHGRNCSDPSSHYMRLYNASATAIKAVDGKLMVGGPATAMLGNVADFVRVCQDSKIPFDFVSTHHYPNDAICPSHERWNPDCFADNVRKARAHVVASASSAEFYMTEYSNSYMVSRGTEHDTSEAAAFAMRQVGELSQEVDVLSWWTFSDIFDESSLPTREFQNWYGLMTFNGVRKPAWRSFQLLNTHAGLYLVPANLSMPIANGGRSSSKPMVSAFVTANASSSADGNGSNTTGAGVKVFLSYWWQPTGVGASYSHTGSASIDSESDNGDRPPPDALGGTLTPPPPNVSVVVSLGVVETVGVSSTAGVATAHIIDAEHGNSRAAWEQMGSPATADITAAQLARLHAASEVYTKRIPINVTHGTAVDTAGLPTRLSVERTINVELSPNSVVVLEVPAT